jgi:uncharacterized protein (TIGR00290 family)
VSRPRALVAWSSGKDSAWTLHVLRQQARIDVVGLLTTINRVHDRVAMHAVRRQLLEAQAAAAALPLWPVEIPSPCSNAEYEAAMAQAMAQARRDGIEQIAFGDLFLADIRAYREARLEGSGIQPLFPLWERPTAELAREMLRAGLEATVTCIDPQRLPAELAGKRWDEAWLARLPEGCDPCGENGEFHTFVTAGPMLNREIEVRGGAVVERDGFVFADLLPAA